MVGVHLALKAFFSAHSRPLLPGYMKTRFGDVLLASFPVSPLSHAICTAVHIRGQYLVFHSMSVLAVGHHLLDVA